MKIMNLLKTATGVVVVCLLSMTNVFAQNDSESEKRNSPIPALEGTYSIATVTMLERPEEFNGRPTLSIEEAANMGTTGESYLDDLTSRPENAEPDVGGYNTFWMDPGERMAVINGEARTSIITFPDNGRLPWAEGARQSIFANRFRGNGEFDGPEARPLGERCLVGFGSSGGPPMLPVLYNNHSQIIQTDDYVVILTEMNHDARIVHLKSKGDDAFPKWLGNSIGYYDDDSLVVETTNFHQDQGFRGALRHFLYLSQDAKVTERFTRIDENTLHYQFTVDDPRTYSTPWTGELPMNAVEDQIYEYACHEGNYSLPGILAGARKQELGLE